RDKAAAFLRGKARVTFAALKAEVFGKGSKVRLTLEAGERAHLLGDIVGVELSKSTAIGPRWHELSLVQQDAICRVLHDAETDEMAISALVAEHGLTEDEARGACEAPLPDGYYRLSQKVIINVLPHLVDG